MVMELRQLRYFVAVAEEANFTRAAAKLHVAQPGVSAQIRQLERELGQPLLDRSGRTVRLTEVGSAVLPYARAALDAAAGAREVVDEFTGLTRGHVAVGMVVYCSAFALTDLLADFHKKYPGVEITLSEDNSDCLIEALQAGQLDMAFAALAGAPPAGIQTQVVVDEPVVVAADYSDPLAARTTVTLEEIRERTLISLPKGTGLRASLDHACATAGFQPRIALEASDPQMLAQLAARGLGLAILPESLAKARSAELHAITVTRPELRGCLALAWRAAGPTSPAAGALISHAREALTQAITDRQGP